MTLRAVVNTPPEVKAARAAEDERIYGAMCEMEAMGVPRSNAFLRVAAAYDITKRQAIAGYWRHQRQLQAPRGVRRRKRAS